MPLPQQIPAKTSLFLTQWISFGMVLLVVGGVIGYSIIREYNHIAALERERLAIQAKVIDANLGNQLHAANMALAGIRRNLPFWKAQKDGMALANQSLRSMSDVMPGLRTFLILDAEGLVVAANRDELIGRNFSERDYFKTPRQHPDPGMFYISPPFTTVLGVFGMNVGRVIPGPNGEFAGIVAATINPEYFTVLLGSVLYTHDMWVVLAHGNGKQFLMVPERKGTLGMDLAKPGSFFTRHRESGRMATVLTGIVYPTGEECLISQRTIKPANVPMDKPLVVAVGRDLTAIYATWRRDGFIQGGLFGLLALATGSGLLFYQRRRQEYERHAASYVARLSETVSELQKAEKASRESEERFRSIVDTASDGILIANISTRKFVEANVAICEMLGYTREELLRLCVENIHPATDLPDVIEEFNKQSRAEKRISESLPVMRKDGSVFYADISANPIELEGEQYQVGIFRDTTERKQAEAERNRLAAAIEQAGETVVITDPVGKIQYVNPAFERTTGYSREEVIGENPRVLNSGKQDEEFYRRLWRTISGGHTWEGRMVNKRKDDTCFTEDATISPVFDAMGKIVNYVAVKRDITDHLRLADQYQQSQKMETVGRLAGGVAHDFNNLLTVITGYSELLLEKVGKGSPMRGELEEIKRAGDRAASLTQQLLAFSRKQIIEPKVVRLDLLVAEMQEMLTRLIGEDIALQATTGKGLGSVKIDPGQFQQILMNLAVNARDAMPGGGKIVIETANVELDEGYCAPHPYVSPGRFVMLAVSDTGKGMSEEVKAHIFEPFFTTKERGKGTGLGLATTYGAVKQSGGSIEVYSEVGIGTIFKIYLPRVEEEAVKPVNDDRPTDLPGGSETVLVVEDEDTVRDLCVRILERLRYKVLRASNGAEAIALAQKYGERIDLLLTDVVMPGMSGSELATQLVLHHPEMKVLFTSGYTDDAIVRHGVLAEGVSFIGKPYTPLALARKVREVLGQA
jgi:PAS domain S-box-containing protein